MIFCIRCGEKLPEDANFCTKCGFRTKRGVETAAPLPTEDWREAFSKMGLEIEKAFQTAAKEVQRAFETVREDFRQSRSGQTVVCRNCGEKNPTDASFCTKCGQKLG